RAVTTARERGDGDRDCGGRACAPEPLRAVQHQPLSATSLCRRSAGLYSRRFSETQLWHTSPGDSRTGGGTRMITSGSGSFDPGSPVARSEAEPVERTGSALPVRVDLDPRLEVHTRPEEGFQLVTCGGSRGLQHRAAATDHDPLLRIALDAHDNAHDEQRSV